MQDFEKLGVFYLGRAFDVEKQKPGEDLILYDARDLTTHAVIVGMTGSGKSGLGIALLEEAAIDAIPSIVIDPKGDLANLALTFPALAPGDFRPYIDPEEARRLGVDEDELARRTAEQWKKGLADWGEDGARIQRLRDAADVAVYTPGSNAGLPLSLLRSFAPPPPEVASDPEALRDRVTAIASGLLALVGVDADPLRSREHILVATILQTAFAAGQALDLVTLIRQVQKPPFDRVGVLDLESFFPSADRFQLAMAWNNLLASPGFSAWTEGEPLEVSRLLHTASGKPRVSVLSIAHLGDAERMFFVSILLGEVIAWMRAQPGTSSLRAILYMDEIAGYFPPTAMPPSKRPMLTLLKQARAFGLGVVLATQNPVDLDYKGLGNAGTWLIGRLQTERDKMRLLDGLEGASAASGRGFDRARMDAILAGLGARVFLMNNVHEDRPVTFQSRWALSWLRGPLSREQLRRLTRDARPTVEMKPARQTMGQPAATTTPIPVTPPAASVPSVAASAERPVLPPEVGEFFFAPGDEDAAPVSEAGAPVYHPGIFGSARLHFVNPKVGLDVWETHAIWVPLGEDAAVDDVDWSTGDTFDGDDPPGLDKQPAAGIGFAPLPGVAARKASYEAWKKSLAAFLYQDKSVTLLRCAALKATSKPGESERDFRVRISQKAKEARDAQTDTLRRAYAPKLAALDERQRKAEERLAREQADFQRQSVDTAISVGTTILGALLGRKVASVQNLNRARSAARSASRTVKEHGDVGEAQAELDAVAAERARLAGELDAEIAKAEGGTDPASLVLDPVEVKARKGDVTLGAVALAWRARV